jgi:DNA-directed RNA polymerase specialized sigma24 family protein
MVLRRESERQVRAVLADLPEDQQNALTWQAFDRHSISEIGEKLQVPHATAKNILNRGRTAIRRKIAGAVRGFDLARR